jgi:hypothetical protein
MDAFSIVELYTLLPRLLRFPIIPHTDHRLEDYIDPLSLTIFLEDKTIEIMKSQNKIELDITLIEKNISFLSDIKGKRKNAFMRLVILYFYNLLPVEQIQKFEKELWNHRDDFGFPDNTNFFYFAFLDLPHPDDINPQELFEHYVSKSKFPIQERKSGKGVQMTGGYFPIFNNIIGSMNKKICYAWNANQISFMLERIIDWWNTDKDYLKNNSLADEFRERFSNMISIFITVLSPNREFIDEKYLSSIKNILNELHEYSMPDIAAKTVFINLFHEKDIVNTIITKLMAKDESDVIDSINAIHVILKRKHANIEKIITTLVDIIKYRTTVFLKRYISLVSFIVKNHQELITDDILNNVFIGLGYLADETIVKPDESNEFLHEKLLEKQACAELVILLRKYLERNQKSIPQCIFDWEKICTHEDEFSEIRMTWKNCEAD